MPQVIETSPPRSAVLVQWLSKYCCTYLHPTETHWNFKALRLCARLRVGCFLRCLLRESCTLLIGGVLRGVQPSTEGAHATGNEWCLSAEVHMVPIVCGSNKAVFVVFLTEGSTLLLLLLSKCYFSPACCIRVHFLVRSGVQTLESGACVS